MHRTTYDVEEFGGDGLLTCLVVGESEFAQKFIGIVSSYLHSDDTSGVFAGQTIKPSSIKIETETLRHKGRHHLHATRLNDVVGRPTTRGMPCSLRLQTNGQIAL